MRLVVDGGISGTAERFAGVAQRTVPDPGIGGVGEVQQIVRPDRHRQIGGVKIGEQHVVVRPEDHLVRNARRAQSGADRGVDVHLFAGILIGAADKTEAGKSGRFAAGNQIDVAVVAEMFFDRAQCDAQFVVRLRRTVGPQWNDDVDRTRHRPRTGLELAARLFPRFGGTCRRGTGTAAGRRLEGGGPLPLFRRNGSSPGGIPLRRHPSQRLDRLQFFGGHRDFEPVRGDPEADLPDQVRHLRVDTGKLLLRLIEVADQIEAIVRRVVAGDHFAGDGRRAGQMLDGTAEAVVTIDCLHGKTPSD